MENKTVVIHSGGMDSTLCLAIAIQEFGRENVCSLSFSYGQRHSIELDQAKKICQDWQVGHKVVSIAGLGSITSNALIDHTIPIARDDDRGPNTLVVGRNGLFARLGAIFADHWGADSIYMGIMEIETDYRDCSRAYMDLMEQILRLDLSNERFEIRTPLVKMTKRETWAWADKMDLMDYLWENTASCYEGVLRDGCGTCPACLLRNKGRAEYLGKETT